MSHPSSPATTHKATFYLSPEIHRAVKLKAATTGTNASSLVEAAIRLALAEDLEDLTALVERRDEPRRPFLEFLKDLQSRGKL